MSATLAEVHASAGGADTLIIRTLELTCDAWSDGPLFISQGFENFIAGTEDGRTVVFEAINLDVALARKDNKCGQTLAFAVDNTTGEVSRRTDEAEEGQRRVNATYRTYLAGNLKAPSERPWRLVVLGGTIQDVVATLQCGYFNMTSVAWPRDLFTVQYTPALRYV